MAVADKCVAVPEPQQGGGIRITVPSDGAHLDPLGGAAGNRIPGATY